MEVLPPDPNDYITSVYDDASRTLVLFGPRERVILAEELINKFETKDGPGGDVRIYFPQTIKAEELANVIRQAVPGVAAPGETAGAAATKARIIADTNLNRLIVAAPIPGQLEQIEQLINRVDKPVHGQAATGNVPLRSQSVQLTKVFRPRAAEATNLASILTQALTRRAPSGQITSTASVSHDPGSQSVVVSGSPGDIQIATDIVTQLETGTTQPTPLQTRFIDVGSASEAKRLQPLLDELYRNQVRGWRHWRLGSRQDHGPTRLRPSHRHRYGKPPQPDRGFGQTIAAGSRRVAHAASANHRPENRARRYRPHRHSKPGE
jgi:type II secretory pathway component GspD/PulD (secretin)